MKQGEFKFTYEVYDSINELPAEDAALLQTAQQATGKSWSPYSHFRVGAAARLKSGTVISGANQENASYPAGICAERVLMSAITAVYPGEAINTMAITYEGDGVVSDHPISPCGICRQSFQEFEHRTDSPIRLIMGGKEGKIYVVPSASLLLPLAFTADELL